jgi:hypothetical protein
VLDTHCVEPLHAHRFSVGFPEAATATLLRKTTLMSE